MGREILINFAVSLALTFAMAFIIGCITFMSMPIYE
jgi:hypothetical protein